MPSSEDSSKAKFTPYGCVPGRAEWEAFKLNLIASGGRANDYGDSHATVFLGTNTGGVNGPGFNGTATQIQKAQQARRKLHSEALEYLCAHIADKLHRDHIVSTFGVLNLQIADPHGAYLYLMQECDVPDSREGEDAIEMEWLGFSVAKDIGKSEHTVNLVMKELRALNAKRPGHMRKTPDEVTEKMLRMLVACSSSAVGTEAQKELEAVAGPAGGPGVRQYQNPAAAAGNTRHHAPLVSHFQKLWSSAFRAGHISMQRATKSVAPATGHIATETARLGRSGNIKILSENGFNVDAHTLTTSNFEQVSPSELSRLAQGMESVECEIVQVVDDHGFTSAELLCHGCGGAGHPRRLCPSPDKPRGHDYMIGLHKAAKEVKEKRAAESGRPTGGQRFAPRGQRMARGGPRPGSSSIPRTYTPRESAREVVDEEEPMKLIANSEDDEEPAVEDAKTFVGVSKVLPVTMPTTIDEYFETGKAATIVRDGQGGYLRPVRVQVDASPVAASRHRQLVVVTAAVAVLAVIMAFICSAATHARRLADYALGAAAMLLIVIIIMRAPGAEGAETTGDPTVIDIFGGHAASPVGVLAMSMLAAGHLGANTSSFINVTVDSGATANLLPPSLSHLLDEITDANPNVQVRGIEESEPLKVIMIGNINKAQIESFLPQPDGTKLAVMSSPRTTRWLVVEGVAEDTALLSVKSIKDRDGILAYFNRDNSTGEEDCLRLPDGAIARFKPSNRSHEIAFFTPRSRDETAKMLRPKNVRHPLEVHASFGHVAADRLADIRMMNFDVSLLSTFNGDCKGCRLGCNALPQRNSTAPSHGTAPSLRRAAANREPSTYGYDFFGQQMDTDLCTSFPPSWPHRFTTMLNACDRHTAEKFVFFLIDHTSAEVASSLVSLGDRVGHRLKDGMIHKWYTDNDLGFDGPEVQNVSESLILSHNRTVANEHHNPVAENHWRNLEGMVRRTMAHADAPACLWSWVARQMDILMYYITTKAHNPAVSSYRFSNPDAEPADLSWAHPLLCDCTVHLSDRDRQGKLSHSGADACYLGRDVNRQASICYVPSLSRISTYQVVDWRCDSFTVCKSITADTPVEYYELNEFRMGNATSSMLPTRFRKRRAQVIQVANATSVEKEGAATTPSRKEGASDVLSENAVHMQNALNSVEKEGEAAFVAGIITGMAKPSDRPPRPPSPPPLPSPPSSPSPPPPMFDPEDRALNMNHHYRVQREMFDDDSIHALYCAACEPCDALVYGQSDMPNSSALEVVYEDVFRATVTIPGEPEINSLETAKGSKYWPLIKEEMENEIRGKLENQAFEAVSVFDEHGNRRRIMKTKWVITITLNADGTLRKIKCRFVACGYSQIEGKDFKDIYASTLSAPSFRLWVITVNDEKMLTDKIDAVKAFTQAKVDCDLFGQMPEGFSLPDHCLHFFKALEGIRQAAHLFYKLQKYAWNRVGMFSDLCDPNFYRHETLSIIAAVFVDDIAAGFSPEQRREYLAIRAEYSKIINVDCLGPEQLVPVTVFIGAEIEWRSNGIARITQKAHARKLAVKYGDKVEPRSYPIPPSKAARDRFEALEPSPDGECFDIGLYLSAMGDIGWATVMTFPQLSYYHSYLGQFMMSPPAAAYEFLLHIVGYIIENAATGISFGGALKIPMGLTAPPPNFRQSYGTYAFTDSSWNKKPKPHGGHVIFRCNGPWMYSGKGLKVIADSTHESETAQASRCTKDLIWARQMSNHIRRPMMGPAYLLCDNKSMTEAVNKEGVSQRTRYFERSTVLIRYAIMKNMVATLLISTEQMVADLFTKPLDAVKFDKFCAVLLNIPWGYSGFKAKLGRLAKALERTLNKV